MSRSNSGASAAREDVAIPHIVAAINSDQAIARWDRNELNGTTPQVASLGRRRHSGVSSHA
jgi:hypothetical protein